MKELVLFLVAATASAQLLSPLAVAGSLSNPPNPLSSMNPMALSGGGMMSPQYLPPQQQQQLQQQLMQQQNQQQMQSLLQSQQLQQTQQLQQLLRGKSCSTCSGNDNLVVVSQPQQPSTQIVSVPSSVSQSQIISLPSQPQVISVPSTAISSQPSLVISSQQQPQIITTATSSPQLISVPSSRSQMIQRSPLPYPPPSEYVILTDDSSSCLSVPPSVDLIVEEGGSCGGDTVCSTTTINSSNGGGGVANQTIQGAHSLVDVLKITGYTGVVGVQKVLSGTFRLFKNVASSTLPIFSDAIGVNQMNGGLRGGGAGGSGGQVSTITSTTCTSA